MKAILTCAGTGGHIYPAIAIADKIKKEDPDAEILFIGTKAGMENTLVPKAGYNITGIDASGFNRSELMKNFKTLDNIVKGTVQARKILKEFKPDVVIGTGGYVTGPVVSTAASMGIKTCIHEQNAIPGMANKMLEGAVKKVFISFEDSKKYFKHPEKTILSGNPIRADFLTLDPAYCRRKLGVTDDTFAVLAFGGSLGAEMLNKAVIRMTERMVSPEGQALGKVKLFFVTGKRYYDEIHAAMDLNRLGDMVQLIPYADNMPELILASNVVISRAGAIAVSEIMASGKPSILIPSPNVTNDHQYHNAKAIADAGAAVLLEEKNLGDTFDGLADAVFALCKDEKAAAAMAEAARRTGSTTATDIIYENLKNL